MLRTDVYTMVSAYNPAPLDIVSVPSMLLSRSICVRL